MAAVAAMSAAGVASRRAIAPKHAAASSTTKVGTVRPSRANRGGKVVTSAAGDDFVPSPGPSQQPPPQVFNAASIKVRVAGGGGGSHRDSIVSAP